MYILQSNDQNPHEGHVTIKLTINMVKMKCKMSLSKDMSPKQACPEQYSTKHSGASLSSYGQSQILEPLPNISQTEISRVLNTLSGDNDELWESVQPSLESLIDLELNSEASYVSSVPPDNVTTFPCNQQHFSNQDIVDNNEAIYTTLNASDVHDSLSAIGKRRN